jgi:NAD(P)H-hydrate epimerase
MQAIERAADAAGHSFAAMMELAGAAVARSVIERHAPRVPRTLVLAGPGNNGGDGLVCARHLTGAEVPVCVYLWKRRTDAQSDHAGHFAALDGLGVRVCHADDDPGGEVLAHWLEQSDVVVDALLGTGASRAISGDLASILDVTRRAVAARPEMDVVAVDCPSGMNCDSGQVDAHTLAADMTVTFGFAKVGHFIFPAAPLCGEIRVDDIGISAELAPRPVTLVLSPELVRGWLPERAAFSHKGTYGRMLVAAGSRPYPGAATLAASAAGRVGAGLVTAAVPEPVWSVAAAHAVEPTWLVLPSIDGSCSAEGAAEVRAEATACDVLLVGCGLTHAPHTVEFVRRLLSPRLAMATVIDADGINCLSLITRWQTILPERVVLTPHPAEFARLTGLPMAQVVAERWELARQFACEWNAVLLVKGPYTVIADPHGNLAVLPTATAALATAGTGDVLAGAIAGLLAQGVALFEAACLAAWLHGEAGMVCEREIGVAGAIASDLLRRLPAAMGTLRNRTAA